MGCPRLVYSPYLILGVMLVLVSLNYWSVSTQNHELLLRIQEQAESARYVFHESILLSNFITIIQ